jgi:hypothetical protein
MKNTLFCFLIALGVAAGIVTTVHHASAEPPLAATEHPYRPLIAQADVPADAGAVTAPAFVDAGSASTPAARRPPRTSCRTPSTIRSPRSTR